jgi:hypothetical protein
MDLEDYRLHKEYIPNTEHWDPWDNGQVCYRKTRQCLNSYLRMTGKPWKGSFAGLYRYLVHNHGA